MWMLVLIFQVIKFNSQAINYFAKKWRSGHQEPAGLIDN